MAFTIDTSINLPILFGLIIFLFVSGGYAQQILSALKSIERIALSVNALEIEVARIKAHLNLSGDAPRVLPRLGKDMLSND